MGIGDWFSQKVTQLTGKTPQQHADAARAALKLPSGLTSDNGASTALDTSADARGPGYTMTGGRRMRRGKKARKTRRGGKKSWY